MLNVYILKVSNSLPDGWQTKMSEYRMARIASLRQPDDIARSVAAELLLCDALGELGFTPPLDISVGDWGKPYIEGVQFSLSHSGEMVICAVSDCAVGVDIEADRADTDRLASRLGVSASQAIKRWCDIECAHKLAGTGLRGQFGRVEIDGRRGVINGISFWLHSGQAGNYKWSVASVCNCRPEVKIVKK